MVSLLQPYKFVEDEDKGLGEEEAWSGTADEEDHEVWYNIAAELHTYAEKITITTLLICTGCPRNSGLILPFVTLS